MRKILLTAILLFLITSGNAVTGYAAGPMTTASRIEGAAPLALFFDAIGDGAGNGGVEFSGMNTARPFHELDFTWNFGDDPAAKWAATNKLKNEAKGAVAAHVYEKPGTYTVRLSVKDTAGMTKQYQQNITVEDPDIIFSTNTTCIALDDLNWNGCPNGAERIVTDDISGTINSKLSQGKRRILLRRGDLWTTSSSITINAPGPGIIGAFGSGDYADIQTPIDNQDFSIITVANDNWVIQDLSLQGPSTEFLQPGSRGLMVTGNNNILILRTKITKTNHEAMEVSDYDAKKDSVFFVENEINQNGGYGIYAGGSHVAFLGNKITETGQHVLRVWYLNKGVISENELLDPTVHYPERSGAHDLKLHNAKYKTDNLVTQYVIISENNFRGRVIPVAIEPQNPNEFELIDNIIFEKNTISSNLEGQVLLSVSATNVTVRNNLFYGDGSSPWLRNIGISQRTSGLPVGPIWIHNNFAYKSDTNNEFRFVDASIGEIYVNNNLVSIPNFQGYLQKLTYITPGYESLVTIHSSNNLFYSPNKANECIDPLGGHACINPSFVNEIQKDFHLQSNSPAIDQGTDVPVFDDFDGNPRPQGTGYDIGAYEYVTPPVITSQASNTSANSGATATFTVTATGAASYQWQKNQVDIPGATDASYTTPVLTADDNGSAYQCIVTNDGGSTISNEVTLTVNPASQGGTYCAQPGEDFIVIEAEHYSAAVRAPDVDGDSWGMVFPAGAVDEGAIQALPDNGSSSGSFGTGTEVTYRFRLAITGIYSVTLRVQTFNGSSDSVHIGLGGIGKGGVSWDGFTNGWSWSSASGASRLLDLGTLNAGQDYILNIDKREDGLIIDRIFIGLKGQASFPASNVAGPAESALWGDITPPIRSSGAPTGTLSYGTTEAALSLTTNESATCKYATVAGKDYASMADTFSTTGGKTHSQLISGLANGGSYTFYIRSQDRSNNVNMDDYVISFSVDATNSTVPLSPGSLTFTTTSDSATLAWVDNSTNEERFIIERRAFDQGQYAVVGETGLNTTSYVDRGLTRGDAFYYRIKAKNEIGDSDPTAELLVTIGMPGVFDQETALDKIRPGIDIRLVKDPGSTFQTTIDPLRGTLSNFRPVSPDNANAYINYAREAGYSGYDWFSYEVGGNPADIAAVKIVITDAPTVDAGVDAVIGPFSGTYQLQPAVNDLDQFPQPLTYQWAVTRIPAGGAITFAGNQTAIPNPNTTLNGHGFYILQLQVNDGALSAADTMRIRVLGESVPEVSDKTVRIYQGVIKAISLVGADADEDPLTFKLNGVEMNTADKANTEGTIKNAFTTPAGGRIMVTSRRWDYGETTLSMTYASASGFEGNDSVEIEVSDESGRKSTAVLMFHVIPVPEGVNHPVWLPLPIGIPEPEFGLGETYRMYDDPVNRNPTLTYTKNAEAESGYYTHYIDNTHPQAIDDDSSNPCGTSAKPRLTIPANLPAGSVVEVHGGPYDGFGMVDWNGTAQQPIFIYGVGMPRFTSLVSLYNSGEGAGAVYTILEKFSLFALTVDSPSHHVATRESEVRGDLMHGGIGIGSYGSFPLHDITVYHNVVHYNGDYTADFDQDVHGIAVVKKAVNIWVMDNEMSYNSGDGIQINGGNNDNLPNFNHIYIGRNLSHHNKQTGFWSKQAADVVFSQNVSHDHRPSNSSYGAGMGFQYGPKNVWFLFNEIYDNEAGFGISGADGVLNEGHYFIGNLIHNIHTTLVYNPDDAYHLGQAFVMWGYGTKYIINNTIYDVDGGIGFVTDPSIHIIDNIISSVKPGSHYIQANGSASSSVRNNILEGAVSIRWGNGRYTSVAAFQSATGQGQGCSEGNPEFVDAAGKNFHLQSTSPAIDKGVDIPQGVKTAFQDSFGMPFPDVDMDGVSRPQDGNGDGTSAHDIGAYEYVPGQGEPIIGDVNDDNAVNVLDAQACVNIILGVNTDTGHIQRAKRVQDPPTDGVTVTNLQAIVNKILGV